MASPEAGDHDITTHTPLYVDDDSITIGSASEVGKPLNTFDTQEDDSDLEDGLESASRHRPRSRRNWWQNMVVRARRKISMEDLKNGLDQALLQGEMGMSRSKRRKRTWYNYCIFGGIGGLTIL